MSQPTPEPIIFTPAAELPLCQDGCEEPWCVKHDDHWADCPCPGWEDFCGEHGGIADPDDCLTCHPDLADE